MVTNMKILVIGGGGREHAVVKKLSESRHAPTLYCAPGNGGIAGLAACVDLAATDIDGVLGFAKNEGIDLVVVTPDDPLAMGMVDALEGAGIRAFGPRKAAARLESSKAFAKEFMKNNHIPTAEYEVFSDFEAACAYIRRQTPPVVVKADGLALGKGVIIAQTVEEAIEAARDMLLGGAFGVSGSRIVVEEFITGPEVSVLAFCDGTTVVPMASAQDHKRAFDNDEGPNTGGMGTLSPSKYYTDVLALQCMKEIFAPTLDAMRRDGSPFVGVLFFGLMLTESGPKLLEYNARFGDPETQVVLPRLKGDLLDIMLACVEGRLSPELLAWDERACVCVVLASGGYPVSYQKGYEITGLAAAEAGDAVTVYHAGTRLEAGKVVTDGGRVLGVSAMGADLDNARQKAYAAAEKIHFTDMQFRRDIGIK